MSKINIHLNTKPVDTAALAELRTNLEEAVATSKPKDLARLWHLVARLRATDTGDAAYCRGRQDAAAELGALLLELGVEQ